MEITAGLAKLKSQINKLERRIHQLDMNEVDPKELHAAIESLNALKARYKEMKEEHEKKKQEKESKVIPMDKDTVVKEHENLVDVLKSPSHADDAEEAKKQEKELAEYKEAKLTCPKCKSTHIQPAEGHKLNKCLSCHLAFDTESSSDLTEVAAEEPKPEAPKPFMHPSFEPRREESPLKFPRRPERKMPKHRVVDVPAPTEPQEKESTTNKFAIHDVVEPSRGTPGSKGRVMGHDEVNDMVYVAWSEGALKDSHGYGAYSAKDLKKHAAQDTDVSVYQVKNASLDKEAGPGAGREFKVGKDDITDGTFIYNMETGKVTWKDMPQILSFDLFGYYDGMQEADGRLVKITDIGAGWWERGQANVKSDLSVVMKEWMKEMPHQWEGITGDVPVGIGFRGLESMIGGGYMRTVLKPGDTFQACGNGYLTSNYDMYEIDMCATLQCQEGFDHFEQDVFDMDTPETDDEGNEVDPSDYADMMREPYRAPRTPRKSSFHEHIKKLAAANNAVINAFVNRTDPNIKSNNLYIRERGNSWDLVNYQTVIAQHLGDKILMDNRRYSVTTTKLQGQIGYQASVAGIPVYDMQTQKPMDHTVKRDDADYNKLPSNPIYKRVSTQADEEINDHDNITDEPMSEDPSDEDIFIQDDRGKTQAWYTGKPIAALENDDWDAFYLAIAKWMADNNYSPNVWSISDHGNAHLVTDIPAVQKTSSGQEAWDVFLNGKHIDTVFATGYDAEEMRRSLINHDGYDPNIVVRKQRVMRSSLNKKATGEPDQDYDHAAYDQMVEQLEAAGISGATHKEFDKYQGVYLKVPGVDRFWGVDSWFTGVRTDETKNSHDFQYKPGTETFHLVMSPENNPDVKVEVIQRGDVVDASELVDYVKEVRTQKMSSQKQADHLYGIHSITHKILQNGDLEISVSDPSELQEIKDAVASGDVSDGTMYDVMERVVANSELEWVSPEDIGALTSAPILGITQQDDHGTITSVDKVWWYPNYQVRSPIEDIAETGKTIFTLAKEDKAAAVIGKKLKKKADHGKGDCPRCGTNIKPGKEMCETCKKHVKQLDKDIPPMKQANTEKTLTPSETHQQGNHEGPLDTCKECWFRFGKGKQPKTAANQIPLNVFDGGFYAVETSGNPNTPHGYAVFDPKGQQVMVVTTEEQLSPDRLSSIVHDEYGKRELVRATLKVDHEAFKTGTKFVVSGINRTKKQIRVKSDKSHVWFPIDKVAVSVDLEQHIQQMKDRLTNTQTTLEQSVTTKAEVEVVADDINTPPPQVLPEGQKWLWNATTKRWVITTVK